MIVYVKQIAAVLSIVVLCIIQVSVVQSYDSIATLLNVPLLLATALLFFRQYTYSYVTVVIAGYLFDMNSIIPFGLFLAAGSLAIAAQLFLQHRVFKQVALHAIALIIMITVVVYQAAIHLGYFLIERASQLAFELPGIAEVFGSMLQMIGAHLLLVAMGASLYALLNKRFAIKGYSYGK